MSWNRVVLRGILVFKPYFFLQVSYVTDKSADFTKQQKKIRFNLVSLEPPFFGGGPKRRQRPFHDTAARAVHIFGGGLEGKEKLWEQQK